jgi:NADH-quinone oxidoreductase subunit A
MLTFSAAALGMAGEASPGGTNVQLVAGILMFAVAAFLMAFVGLMVGSIVRPTMPHPEKATAYECGEPAIGTSWVQFDLRFYTVALVFIVFDVEVALLWPWAVVFKQMPGPAFWAFFVFFLLLAIPFAYEWKSGYLDWVRASTGQHREDLLEEDSLADVGGPSTEAPAGFLAGDGLGRGVGKSGDANLAGGPAAGRLVGEST